MPFKLFQKKAPAKKPVDPLAVFDELIASVERQGVTVRQSAATLGALRGQLKRDVEKYERRVRECETRTAEAQSDPVAARRLSRDALEAARLLTESKEALARTTVDAEHLLATAEKLADDLASLKAERVSARTRVTASTELSTVLSKRAEDFDRLLKLDKARDEVERAHALAELYREDESA